MKTYEFKNTLFEYFNNRITVDIPELNGKIFREHLKINCPQPPFICIKSGERTRINKRYENFIKNDIEYTRVQYRIILTFCVHSVATSPVEAEQFADETVDYIEKFFIDDSSTHADLSESGIIINELLCSGVKDTSSFAETNQEFVRELDIVFEFEDVSAIVPELGQELQTNIQPKD